MQPTHHLPTTRAFTWPRSGRRPISPAWYRDATLDRFQPVAGIGQRPHVDDRIGILEERTAHLLADVDVDDALLGRWFDGGAAGHWATGPTRSLTVRGTPLTPDSRPVAGPQKPAVRGGGPKRIPSDSPHTRNRSRCCRRLACQRRGRDCGFPVSSSTGRRMSCCAMVDLRIASDPVQTMPTVRNSTSHRRRRRSTTGSSRLSGAQRAGHRALHPGGLLDRVALVITQSGLIIGVGRYDRISDHEAEIAFTVRDDHQGAVSARYRLSIWPPSPGRTTSRRSTPRCSSTTDG